VNLRKDSSRGNSNMTEKLTKRGKFVTNTQQ
jgi:hypothetical protein